MVLIILSPFLGFLFIESKMFKGDYDSEFWSNYGNFISGLFGPIVAVVGTIVSYLIHVSNREKQEMQQRPLLYISHGDFDHHLEIRIGNKGIGALIITDYQIKRVNEDTDEVISKFGGIYDVIKDIQGPYKNYSHSQENEVLAPGEEKNIFKLSTDKGKAVEKEFISARDKVRKVFKDIVIEVTYKDIYGKKMEVYKKSLKWFGRHFESPQVSH